MRRLIKYLFYLIILAAIGLAAYALYTRTAPLIL